MKEKDISSFIKKNRCVFYYSIAYFVCYAAYLGYYLLEDGLFTNDGYSYLFILDSADQVSSIKIDESDSFPPTFLIITYYIKSILNLKAYHAAVIYSLTCGAMIPVLGFTIIRKLTRQTSCAILYSLLALFNPAYRGVICNFLRDSGSIMLNHLSILFFILYLFENKKRYYVLSISFSVFSVGFRYENLELTVFLIIAGTANLIYSLYKKPGTRVRAVMSFASFTVFSVFIGGYALYLLNRETEFFSPTHISQLVGYYRSMMLM